LPGVKHGGAGVLAGVGRSSRELGIVVVLAGALALFFLVASSAAPVSATPRALSLPSTRGEEPGPGFSIYLPLAQGPVPASECPTTSSAVYLAVPMHTPPTDRPAPQHGDLNLALRGYVPTTADLGLVDYDGETDSDPPQLPGLVRGSRVPGIASAYRVREWDWGCGSDGCRGEPIDRPPVTLIGIAVNAGEQIYIPSRDAEVNRNASRAVVLYADSRRITLKYTTDDNVVRGYAVHIEDVCVDPSLLSLYRDLDAHGRQRLPGLRNDDPLGTAPGSQIGVAVRDSGSFMDPRAKKDWWQIVR